ncbi:major facilitator superfamily domain-containing protein 6-B-like [Adelges cooleyi]|uniref:major facilitator superfamily domain-containing protein 6-B-like n=1 Tax=Adelges cooleyi TaxID=133065 RepID=UPI00217F37A4|nr:major facilitator superfamily domain-containing protein 6-B-like [Adelges cooleyi]XP_050441939.1 major facilitator superfamily domain-containing protein 6-B-like [Adelges cooleyi]XP_050441947.1 major facilitator superfamily domain-containing protein 6-B-like [Adelges cooleyi]
MAPFKINKKLILMKACFFIFDSGTAPINTFLPTIAKERGMPVFVVGLILTFVPILNVLVRPFAGFTTDRWRCRRAVFLGASLANVFLTPALHIIPSLTDQQKADGVDVWTTYGFWLFLLVITLRMTLWMIGDVLQDTICMGILGKDTAKYGGQRIFGAVGWGISSAFVGWCVDLYSKGQPVKDYLPAYIFSMVLSIIHFVVASRLDTSQNASTKNDKSVGKVLKDVKVAFFLVWATIAGVFTAFVWYYLFIHIEHLTEFYHPERKPWIKTIEGFSFTVQCCIGELPIYVMSDIILKKIGHMTAFSVSFVMFSIRFFLYSIIKDPVWILPVELINGVSFAMAFLSGISYAAKVAPAGSEGTLQGLFGMAFQGLGISLGCFVAGYTFDTMGSSKSFQLMSYVAFIAFAIQVVVNRLVQSRKTNNARQKQIESNEIDLCQKELL